MTRGRPKQKTWRVKAKMVRILRWIKPLRMVDNTPDDQVALDDRMNAQLSINKVGTLLAVITAEDNKASVLTEQLMVRTTPIPMT